MNFKEFLKESTVLTEEMAASDMPGVPKVLHDFLFHLSGPSDQTTKSLSEGVLFDIARGDRPGEFERRFPKTAHMVKIADTLVKPGENLHKSMGAGLKKADDEMSKEDPATRKQKLKEAKAVFDKFSKERGYKKAPASILPDVPEALAPTPNELVRRLPAK